MGGLIAFWSHAIATAMFAALLIWRLGSGSPRAGARILLAAFALTSCWAWLAAIGPADPITAFAETARNLMWISLLYSLSAAAEDRQKGLKLVYAAVAGVIGLQLLGEFLNLFGPTGSIRQTGQILHITTAAGALGERR